MHKFGMAAVRVKPFLIYTATAHKSIDVEKLLYVKAVKVIDNSYPLILISMLKSKISVSSFIPSTWNSMLIFKNSMLKYTLLLLI